MTWCYYCSCIVLDNCSCIILPSPKVNCACAREGALGCVHGLVPPASDPHGCGKCGEWYGIISAVQANSVIPDLIGNPWIPGLARYDEVLLLSLFSQSPVWQDSLGEAVVRHPPFAGYTNRSSSCRVCFTATAAEL